MFSPACIDDTGKMTKHSWVECSLVEPGVSLGWNSDVPDKCPYILEHKMTEEAIEELGEPEPEGEDET